MRMVTRAEAARIEVRNPTGDGWGDLYIGRPGTLHEGPQAYLVGMPVPGARTEPHFHDVDQFQIAIEGGGVIGKRQLAPVTIQYADAYTPYGPIIAAEQGLAYFTLRQSASNGFFPMPGSKGKMPGRAGRNIVARFETRHPLDPKWPPQIEPLIPETSDGMSVLGIHVSHLYALDLEGGSGGGRYYLICAGSAVVEGRTLPAQSLIYMGPDEGPVALQPGLDGAELVVAQFPRPTSRPGSDPAILAARNGASYQMPPGTKFD